MRSRRVLKLYKVIYFKEAHKYISILYDKEMQPVKGGEWGGREIRGVVTHKLLKYY